MEKSQSTAEEIVLCQESHFFKGLCKGQLFEVCLKHLQTKVVIIELWNRGTVMENTITYPLHWKITVTQDEQNKLKWIAKSRYGKIKENTEIHAISFINNTFFLASGLIEIFIEKSFNL